MRRRTSLRTDGDRRVWSESQVRCEVLRDVTRGGSEERRAVIHVDYRRGDGSGVTDRGRVPARGLEVQGLLTCTGKTTAATGTAR